MSPEPPLRLTTTRAGSHFGSRRAFRPDGYLYIAMGEGGAAHGIGEVEFGALEVPKRGNVWDFQAKDLETPYGKILRIDVDRGWPGYGVPQSNPLVGKPGMDEIYAWGFRNHYRMSFDPEGNHDLMVAAVSESLWEAVYRVNQPGNYGWPIREGTSCYDRQSPVDPPETCPDTGPEGWPIQDPVIQYANPNVLESPIDADPLGTAGELYVLTRESFGPQGETGKVFKLVPRSEDGSDDGASARDGADADPADARSAGGDDAADADRSEGGGDGESDDAMNYLPLSDARVGAAVPGRLRRIASSPPSSRRTSARSTNTS